MITELFYAESEGAPPANLDLRRIMRDGRRRKLRRRVLGPVGAAAMVLALAVGVAVLRVPPPPASQAPVDPSPSSTAPAGAPVAFDPLRLHVAAGWVPDGMIPQPPEMSRLAQRIWFSERPSEAGIPNGHWVDITLYAADVTPWQLVDHGVPELRPTLVPTDPVNGAEAKRMTFSRRASNGLAWRWAPDAWAVVRYDELGPDGASHPVPADLETVLRQVAENVRTDVDLPIQVPFTLAAPAGMHLVQIDQYEGEVSLVVGHPLEPIHRATLAFAATDPTTLTWPIDSFPPGLEREQPWAIVVHVEWQVFTNRRKPEPDRTIAGHPVAVTGFQGDPGWDSNTVTTYDVSGYTVTVELVPATTFVLDLDAAIALGLSVQILGPPTDKSQWTDNPIR